MKKPHVLKYLLMKGIPFFVSNIIEEYAGVPRTDFTLSVLKESIGTETLYGDNKETIQRFVRSDVMSAENLDLSEDVINSRLLVYQLNEKEREYILDNLGTLFLVRNMKDGNYIYETSFAAHYKMMTHQRRTEEDRL